MGNHTPIPFNRRILGMYIQNMFGQLSSNTVRPLASKDYFIFGEKRDLGRCGEFHC